MNVLDLFSGIGGFSLGLECAGMRTVAFCECDPYCQAVLRKHWPDVPVFGDVRTLTAEALADAAWNVRAEQETRGTERQRIGAGSQSIDLICGGFPCQDISLAGKGAGLDGARSGLWKEFTRIIDEVRPRYVIVENVAALLGRGLSRVLGDLASLGYDAEWHCIPASAVGAPHRRDRLWIVANCAASNGRMAASNNGRSPPIGLAEWIQEQIGGESSHGHGYWRSSNQWLSEPDVGRVAHGVPSRVDRLRTLGNAVVPQITEIIGRAIMSASA